MKHHAFASAAPTAPLLHLPVCDAYTHAPTLHFLFCDSCTQRSFYRSNVALFVCGAYTLAPTLHFLLCDSCTQPFSLKGCPRSMRHCAFMQRLQQRRAKQRALSKAKGVQWVMGVYCEEEVARIEWYARKKWGDACKEWWVRFYLAKKAGKMKAFLEANPKPQIVAFLDPRRSQSQRAARSLG